VNIGPSVSSRSTDGRASAQHGSRVEGVDYPVNAARRKLRAWYAQSCAATTTLLRNGIFRSENVLLV